MTTAGVVLSQGTTASARGRDVTGEATTSRPTAGRAWAGGVGLRSERGPILGAVMLATGLVAIDSTIIATAVPSIVADLGGFAQFPWLFSVYLLAQAVSVPVYGKLADLFGRKPVILFGIGLFLLGSVLCGVAWSMRRADRVPGRAGPGRRRGRSRSRSRSSATSTRIAERAKAQGYIASVWGDRRGRRADARRPVRPSTPPGAGSSSSTSRCACWPRAMLVRNFHEQVERSRPADRLPRRACCSPPGCTLLILAVLEGGQAWAWDSPAEHRDLRGRRGAAGRVRAGRAPRAPSRCCRCGCSAAGCCVASSLIAAGVGAVLLGLTSYVPTYVQEVLGHGPLVAGFALATLIDRLADRRVPGRPVYLRIGFRDCALIGASVIVVGTALLLLLGAHTSVWQVAATCLVVGLGMGLAASPTLIAAQSSVGWTRARRGHREQPVPPLDRQRASASPVFGALANAVVGRVGSGGRVDPVALTTAVHHIFLAVVVIAVLMLATAFALPRTVADA